MIDAILGKKLQNEDAYAELVISIGLERMLQDPLPKEEMLLNTILAMFEENSEFVSNFVAKTLKRGEEMQEERVIKTKEDWLRAYE